MNVLEIAVAADAEGAEAVAALFNEHAYGGAVIEETIAPEPGESFDPARPFTVRAYLLMDAGADQKRRALETALWHLAQLRSLSPPRVRELQEEDWANAWKKHYTILHVGQKIVVKPSWLEYAPRAAEIVVELDPGMAFGTGLHPTTRMCLALIESVNPRNARVADIGTGSGILSIAAARLGAREIFACDLDPIAVETARKNVELNGMSAVVSVAEGAFEPDAKPFDLICINILAEVVAEHTPRLVQALAPRGKIIASGILVEKRALVADAFRTFNLDIIAEHREDDWLALLAAHL
jgi:ribosomal protein L11 methyltransferase